jgi:GNAT superfamily N-acetyltransferase
MRRRVGGVFAKFKGMVSFRAAAPSDVPALVALVNSGYRGESSKRGWTTEADILGGQRTDAEKMAEMIGTPDSRIELAFAPDGALAGCVYLKKEPDGSCYLGMLTVDPARQAGGLGKAIMARSEAVARAWGCARMRMTVISVRSELIAYYERRGYAKTGATRPFPENDPRFGLPKVRGLMFAELVKPLA